MKAVFSKADNKCVGMVSHCSSGEEAALVGFKEEDVIVSDLSDDIFFMIDDPQNSLSFRNLELINGDISINSEPVTHIVQLSQSEKDLIFIKDKNNPIAERFNKALDILISRGII